VLQWDFWASCWERLYIVCGSACSSPWSGRPHAGDSSLLVLLMFAAVVFHAHRRLSAPDSIHEQGVILPSWSGREPTLLARLHPRSSLTSWVGPEALPDFLAGQSSPRVMLRITDDLHAHSDDLQCESTAMAVSSGLLEVAPTLSASTLGRFQPPGPSDSHFGRTCQACCKPHDLQQQQPQLRRSCDLQFRTLALPPPYSLAPSDHIGTYLASRSLSAQQLLLRQAEYAYAISVFRFAGLDMNIRHSQGQYAAQCLSAWRGQRTSLVQQLQGFFMAPLNDTRAANSQQQLPGMSGLVLNSMTSSPSAWVWFQTPRLATSAGRLSIEPMTPRCRTLQPLLWSKQILIGDKPAPQRQISPTVRSPAIAFLVQVSCTDCGTLGGRVSMLGLSCRLCAVLQNAEN